MRESGAVLPGAQAPESFFGRVAELKRLRHEARSLLRGQARSRAVWADPGSGKTELLLQWHGRLFREGEIPPLRGAGLLSAVAGDTVSRSRRRPHPMAK